MSSSYLETKNLAGKVPALIEVIGTAIGRDTLGEKKV